MMNKDEQIQEIELDIATAKAQIAEAEALQRLHKNEDFKKVFTEGYFRDESARLVSLLADPNMADPKQQEYLQRSIRSVSELRQYFAKVFHFGELSSRALEQYEQVITEIENETEEEG